MTHNELMPIRKGKKLSIAKTDELKAAEDHWIAYLAPYSPERPFSGAVRADIKFSFACTQTHANGTPHTEKPDSDNIEKTFWDVLQKLGYIEDDKLVFDKRISKMWCEFEGVYISLQELDY